MTEKMGFETNRRIVRVMRNQPITATVGGQTCRFRSKFECNWARYLQWLTDRGVIQGWQYEVDLFLFPGEITAPVQYRPDFKVTEAGGVICYEECKGYHDGATNKKFQRMAKHHPDVEMELVLMRIPKRKPGKGINRRKAAERYVRRIIDASEIFRQTRGAVKYI